MTSQPDLSYFELSYIFWEHKDGLGQGITVLQTMILTFASLVQKVLLQKKSTSTTAFEQYKNIYFDILVHPVHVSSK